MMVKIVRNNKVNGKVVYLGKNAQFQIGDYVVITKLFSDDLNPTAEVSSNEDTSAHSLIQNEQTHSN